MDLRSTLIKHILWELKLQINLDAVIRSEFPAVIRRTAKTLQEVPYLTVGQFLQSLSDDEIEEIESFVDVSMCVSDEDDDIPFEMESLVLLTEMLATAEGVSIEQPDVTRINALVVLLTLERLKRKGRVVLYYDKMTLGSDNNTAVIARLPNTH